MLIPVLTGRASQSPSDRTSSGPSRGELALVAGLIVVAAALRFATIAHQSYWVDEALTVHETHLSIGGLFHELRVTETTPPLYFVLAWLWAKVFGAGEVALRSLSALAGVAIVPVAYACGRDLVSRATGLVAAALAAVSPFLIWYSQEARAYMLFATLCGLSFMYFVALTREADRRTIVLWGVTSVLATATHFFSVFVVWPEAIWVLWRVRRADARAAVGAVAVTQIALVPLLLNDAGHALGWIKAFPLSIRVKQVFVDFSLSSLYQSQAVTYGLVGAIVLGVVVAALIWFGGGPRRRRGAAIAAVLGVIVVIVPMVAAALGRDYLVPRNLIAGWLPLAILLAAACTAPRTLPFGVALAGLVLGAFIWAQIKIDSDAQYQRPDWRGVARVLGPAPPSGDRAIVAYDSAYATLPLSLYLRGVPWSERVAGPVSVGEVDIVANAYSRPASTLPAGVRTISSSTVGGFLVVRYAVTGWQGTPAALGARAASLVPGGAQPAVLIQREH